jgi:hypothetical protein
VLRKENSGSAFYRRVPDFWDCVAGRLIPLNIALGGPLLFQEPSSFDYFRRFDTILGYMPNGNGPPLPHNNLFVGPFQLQYEIALPGGIGPASRKPDSP